MKTREDAAFNKFYKDSGTKECLECCFGKSNAKLIRGHMLDAWEARGEHKAEKYKKLVEWAKGLQTKRTFSAVAEVELDQILKEIGDE